MKFLDIEMTSDGDTNTKGLIIWLGTKNEKTAERRMKILLGKFLEFEKKKKRIKKAK